MVFGVLKDIKIGEKEELLAAVRQEISGKDQ